MTVELNYANFSSSDESKVALCDCRVLIPFVTGSIPGNGKKDFFDQLSGIDLGSIL